MYTYFNMKSIKAVLLYICLYTLIPEVKLDFKKWVSLTIADCVCMHFLGPSIVRLSRGRFYNAKLHAEKTNMALICDLQLPKNVYYSCSVDTDLTECIPYKEK